MLLAALFALAAAGPAASRPVAASRMALSEYQVFVAAPGGRPTCARVRSRQTWEAILHPAAVMFANRPFAPPEGFWRRHEVLVLGRETSPGRSRRLFQAVSVRQDGGGLIVSYRLAPAPAGSYTIIDALMLAIPAGTAGPVRFVENGRVVCAAP